MNTNMHTSLDSYANHLFVSGASADTIRHRTGVMRRISEAGIDPLTCTASDLINYLARFRSPATRASYRAAIRAFYAWAVDFTDVADDPSAKIPKVKVPRTAPRPISDGGLAALIEHTHGGTRAVVILMAYCGLRGSEATNVLYSDFYQSGESWRLRITKPKGGGMQTVPVPTWVAVHTRRAFPIHGSYDAMITRIARLLKSIEPGATPHSLRHWYATTALRQSGNVRIVQELLRHKSLSSTQIYTQVTEADGSAVVEELPHRMYPGGQLSHL